MDLSWLPDPDKAYGENSDDDEGDEDENLLKAALGKRKTNAESSSSDDDVDQPADSIQPFKKKLKVTSKLTLDDAELIAAQLLAKSM